jgi:hypothetical protein
MGLVATSCATFYDAGQAAYARAPGTRRVRGLDDWGNSLMKPEEIAAYIGAAAWLPQIVRWIYRAWVTPKMQVFLAQSAEVGFTGNGPILNVRMVFCADRQDAIFDDIELVVRHEDGETKTLRWAGLGDNMGEATDAAGNRQTFTRDLSPIAVKIGTQAPLEKFVRFQETIYHDAMRTLTEAVVNHFTFLKRGAEPEVYVPQLLGSKEFAALNEGRLNSFWWKQGRYTLTVRPSSPTRFDLLHADFEFTLSPADVNHLKRNLAALEADLRNTANSNLKEHAREPIHWQWVYPTLSRKIGRTPPNERSTLGGALSSVPARTSRPAPE